MRLKLNKEDMRKNIKANNLISKNILLFMTLASLYACSSSNTTIRIKTDPNRSVRDLVSPIETEKPLEQTVLTAPPISTESKEELLAVKVNRLLNHFVMAEDLLAEGKLNEAEKEMIKGSYLIKTKEGWSVLAGIYEQMGNKAKADSCKRLIKSFSQETAGKQPNFPK